MSQQLAVRGRVQLGPVVSIELVASVDSRQMMFLLHVIREISKSLRIFDSRFMKLLVLWSLKIRLPSWDTMGPGVP